MTDKALAYWRSLSETQKIVLYWLVYLFGFWLTFGVVYNENHGLCDSGEYGGYGLNDCRVTSNFKAVFSGLIWPFYWFFRQSIFVFSWLR